MNTDTNRFYSWRTTKTAAGFVAIVCRVVSTSEEQPNGRYAITTELHRTTPQKSRAIAKRKGQAFVKRAKATRA